MIQIQNINGHNFEMGHSLDTRFNSFGGIYLIYTEYQWLDVGESGDVGERIASHDRRPDWLRAAGGYPIYIGVHMESNSMLRLLKESGLRAFLNPTCGDR